MISKDTDMPPPAPPARPNKPQIALPMGEKAAAEVIPNASPTPDPNERWAPPRAATPSWRRSVAPSRKKKNGAGDISIAVQTQTEHGKFIENRKIKMWAARQPWLGLAGAGCGWRSVRKPSTPNDPQNQLAMASIDAFRRGRSGARGSAVSRSSPRASNAGSAAPREAVVVAARRARVPG